MEDQKKHAYFQDQYRRSSNFGKTDGDKKSSSAADDTIESGAEESEDVKEIRKTLDNLSKESEEE